MDKEKISKRIDEINRILMGSGANLKDLDGFVMEGENHSIQPLLGAFSTYYHFVEKIDIPVLTVDISGKILYVNRAAERFLEISYFKVITQPFHSFVKNEIDQKRVQSIFDYHTISEDGFNLRLLTNKGNDKCALCLIYPISMEDLEVFGVVLIDVSGNEELKKLAEQEQTIRKVLNNSASYVFLIDAKEKIKVASQQVVERVGEWPEGKKLSEVMTIYEADFSLFGSDSSTIKQKILDVKRELTNLPVVVDFKNGLEFWGLLNVSCLTTPHEETSCVISILDVTDSLRQSQSLFRTEEKFKALIDSSSDLVINMSKDKLIAGLYGRSIEKYHIDPHSWIGKSISEIFTEQDAKIHEEKVQEAFSGKTLLYEWTSPGEKYWTFQISISPIYNIHGDIDGLIAIARDVSDISSLEQKLDYQRNLYKLLFEYSPQAIMLIEKNELVLWNVQLNRLLEATDEEIMEDFLRKKSGFSSKIFNTLNGIADDVSQYFFELETEIRSGMKKYIRVSVARFQKGNSDSWHLILSDITKQRRLTLVKELQQSVTNWIFERKPLANLCQKIETELNKIIPVNNLYLAQLNTAKNRLEFYYLKDEHDDLNYVDATGTMSSYTIQTGKIQLLQSSDIEKMVGEGHFQIVGTKPESWLGAPLLLSEPNPFILVIQSYDPRIIYTQEDVELIDYLKQNIELVIRENMFIHNMRQYEFFIDKGPLSVIITDINGDITYVNKKFTDITGFSAAEVIGKNPKLLQSGLTDSKLYEQLWDTIANGKIWFGEFINKRKNNEIFYERAIIGPIYNEKDEIVNYMGIKEDITKQRQMEQNLLQTQKMESIGTLVGGIAHDFNNMLTAINGYAEMALMRLEPGHPLHKYISAIADAGRSAQDITNQLLAFSRKQIHQPKAVCINDLLVKYKKMLSRLIPESMQLSFVIPHENINIWSDPVQIEQILINLVVNARDAIEAHEEASRQVITIEILHQKIDESYVLKHPGSSAGEYCCLVVSDTGCGIPEKIKEKIFEPFFTTKAPGKGTGMGLATVFGIVKQNNGFIYVYSEPGKGTSFKIYWPVFKGSIAHKEEDKQTKIPVLKGKILIVEDQDNVRNFAAESLQELGYEVTSVESGEKAIALLESKTSNFDIMITDLVLPGMNGIELAERTKQILPELKVIYTSGYTDNHVVSSGVLEPHMKFLQKPYTMNALAVMVAEVLSGK